MLFESRTILGAFALSLIVMSWALFACFPRLTLDRNSAAEGGRVLVAGSLLAQGVEENRLS